MKAHVIEAWIMWVSNYRDPITKRLIWIPVIGHPCDHAPIMLQIGAQRANHDQNFIIDTITGMCFIGLLLTGNKCFERYDYRYVFYRAFSDWQQMFRAYQEL